MSESTTTPTGRRVKIARIVAYCCIAVVVGGLGWCLVECWKTLHLMQRHNDLRAIGLALHAYHDRFHRFPPRVFKDQHGHEQSWRTLIVPLMEFPEPSTYRLGEPWNSPHNRTADPWLNIDFACLAVVDAENADAQLKGLRIQDITDGTSNTILGLCVKNSGVDWHEPRDLTLEDHKLWLTERNGKRRQIVPANVFILFGDGHLLYCPREIPGPVLAAMVSTQGDDTQVIENWNW